MQNTFRPCASRHRRTLAVALLTAVLAAACSAYAANDLWIGNTDANFNTLLNWTGSVTPNGNTPEFGVAGGSGTTLNNDISSASYAGFLFDSGASAYTIGGNAFTLTANVTNNSSSTQTINNDITLSSASHTLTGPLAFGGNVGGTINGSVTVTPGTGNSITLGGTNNIVFTTGTFLALLTNAGTTNITGSTTLDGGSGSNDGGFVVGANAGAGTTSTMTIANGGSFHVKGTTAGAANTTPNSIIGQQSGNNVLNVGATDQSTSGTFTVDAGTGLLIGNSGGNGTLNVNSGTATINRGSIATTSTFTDNRLIMMGKDSSSSTGTINLNGGTLATDRQFVRDGSTATGAGTANFVFNGGTLKALGTQTDWLQSTTATSAGQNQGATGGTVNGAALALSSVTTTSAASTIDSNSFSVAINNAITGTGGFHITDSSVAGTGIVHFGGASYAYTGTTSVDSGTFNTNLSSVAFAGAIALNGGKLTLNGTGAGSVGTTGFSMGTGSTWTVSIGDHVALTGNLSITGGTLDVSAFSGSEATYSTTGYSLFTSISGTSSVSGVAITGYDTTNYAASLSNAGVLTFSAIPEPSTYAAIAGLGVLALAAYRRRKAPQA